ncbi:cupin domain-containing protein [Acidithiobacillus ferrivorans]|uniref:hypothetical protein n=1 Tax=Acidithiobacillus ferrivorans TaxID=160808 RepID=UPI001E5B52E9|nr:hypothetical protein [Acidithiobacillus ferrivorans]
MGNAAPSFDDPVRLLRACHERILGHCETLERLAEHLARVGADSEARLAAARIRRYFHVAGPAHHADDGSGRGWVLSPERPGWIPPDLSHRVEFMGPVRFYVSFWR